jgi:hypothetical protein
MNPPSLLGAMEGGREWGNGVIAAKERRERSAASRNRRVSERGLPQRNTTDHKSRKPQAWEFYHGFH